MDHVAVRVPRLAEEFRGVSLGDRRLDVRLGRILKSIEGGCSSSLPDIFENDSQLEAFYRFSNNGRITLDRLLAPHRNEAVKRIDQHRTVLAVHDSSEFDFNGERGEGLYKLRSGKSGFMGHFTLAVTADGKRNPLGVLAYRTVERQERTGNSKWRENYDDPNKESARWLAAAAEVEDYVHGDSHLIHVMDREGDSFEIFSGLVALGTDFVIRLKHDRRVDEESVISERIAEAPVILERSVALSSRAPKSAPDAKAKHPPREERIAQLEVVACEVRIQRPHHDRSSATELCLRVVHVREPHPPEGMPAIDWRIVTTLPIGTPVEVAAIVDHYRARWLIEEYFKALKTGCGYSLRQQMSLDALERTLAICIPQAWRLLAIRWTSRNEPAAPAAAVVTDAQLQCLKLRNPKATLKTAHDVALAIAQLGGHVRSNGAPGWLVLGRGLQKLSDMEAMFIAMREAMTLAPEPPQTGRPGRRKPTM